jgi:hypothetical protein
VPTLREAEAAGNTWDVNVDLDVNQTSLIESAGGESRSDVPLPDVLLLEARLDFLVGEE